MRGPCVCPCHHLMFRVPGPRMCLQGDAAHHAGLSDPGSSSAHVPEFTALLTAFATDGEKPSNVVKRLLGQVFRRSESSVERGGGRTARGALCEALVFALVPEIVEEFTSNRGERSLFKWLESSLGWQRLVLERAFSKGLFTADQLAVLDVAGVGVDDWPERAAGLLDRSGVEFPAQVCEQEPSPASENLKVGSVPDGPDW
jgi:hypothetical protein